MSLTDPIPLHEVHRALVIKLRHHGDVLLATPVLHALKARVPHCEIDALVYAETAPMITLHPALSQLHVIDRQWKHLSPVRRVGVELALLKTLRARSYDLILHLTDHPRGAWLSRITRAHWAVGPARAGRGWFWRNSFSHLQALPMNARRHTVERHLDSLRRVGLYPEPHERVLTIVAGEPAQARAQALLSAADIEAGKYIVIHPVSRWMFKSWPAERFAEIGARLQAQGWQLVFTAGPDAHERAFVASVLAGLRQPALDLSGQLSLKELAAIIGGARMFIGLDTAPMHMAAALKIPTVAMFGPSADYEWGPWDVSHRVVASTQHPCRPCHNDGCGGGWVSDCLVRLPTEEAWRAVSSLLSETQTKPEKKVAQV